MGNSPLSFVDPFGLAAREVGSAGYGLLETTNQLALDYFPGNQAFSNAIHSDNLGDAAFYVALSAAEVASAGVGGGSGSAAKGVAYGFKNIDDFAQFGKSLNSGLADAGFGGTKALLQGSAVTGTSYRTGIAFDVGRVSDFDIALAGSGILATAKQLGIGLRSQGTRTGPLSAAEVQQLGLGDLQSTLSNSAGRPVNFMVFGNTAAATSKAPSIGF